MMAGDLTTMFLPLPATPQHLATLDRVVMTKTLATVGGPSGSGKTALVGHWATTRPIRLTSNPHDQVLLVALPRANAALPMEYTVCLRVWHALQRLAGTHYLIPQRLQRTTYRTFSKRNLEWLSIAVSELLEQCPIRAIVIDNAHHLDQGAIERVLEWRTWYDERRGRVVRRAVILVATTTPEPSQDHFTTVLQQHAEAAALWRDQVTLTHLTQTECFQVLGHLIDGPLHADFSPALGGQLEQIGQTVCARVQGNWHYLMAWLQHVDLILGQPTYHRRRMITPTVLQHILPQTSE